MYNEYIFHVQFCGFEYHEKRSYVYSEIIKLNFRIIIKNITLVIQI